MEISEQLPSINTITTRGQTIDDQSTSASSDDEPETFDGPSLGEFQPILEKFHDLLGGHAPFKNMLQDIRRWSSQNDNLELQFQ